MTDADYDKSVQNPVQSTDALVRKVSSDVPLSLSLIAESKSARYLKTAKVTPTGLEPVLPA